MTVAERKLSVAFFCATESAMHGATGRAAFFVHRLRERVQCTDVDASTASKARARPSGPGPDDLFVP